MRGGEVVRAAELMAIRKREGKATPAPWFASTQTSDGQNFVTSGKDGREGPAINVEVVSHDGEWKVDLARQQADAEFIANARADVPMLLDAIAEYERVLRETQRRLDEALVRFSE